MGTHGVIARPYGDGWEGRYHHSDSIPRWLGRTLWEAYHGHFAGDIDAMQRYFIEDHPAGWSYVVDADFSREAGWVDFPYGSDDATMQAYRATPQCYCHGTRSDEAYMIRDDGTEPFDQFMQWVYVLAPTGMDVLAAGRGRYEHIAFLPWGAAEPDWEALEERRYGKEAA